MDAIGANIRRVAARRWKKLRAFFFPARSSQDHGTADEEAVSIPFSKDDITIVFETNVYVRGNKASVWVAPGFYDDGDDDCPVFSEVKEKVKIVGPINSKVAYGVFYALIDVFTQCGIRVSELQTADD